MQACQRLSKTNSAHIGDSKALKWSKNNWWGKYLDTFLNDVIQMLDLYEWISVTPFNRNIKFWSEL